MRGEERFRMWGEKPFRIWGTELFRVRGAEPVGTEVCTEPVGAATGRSLGMDVTVSELMELFLQSPLVTWVSAPGSQPQCWCPGSSPTPLGSLQT